MKARGKAWNVLQNSLGLKFHRASVEPFEPIIPDLRQKGTRGDA